MKNTTCLIALLALMVTAARAQGVLSDTSTFVGARSCNPGGSGCDTFGPSQSAVGGNPGDTGTSISQNVYGLTTASAALTGVIGEPTLTAYSTSSATKRDSAAAYALQSYTYTGSTPTTDTFGGTVTYSQTMTGTYPPATGVGTEAEIEVFTLSTSSFAAGASPSDNYTAMSDPSTQTGFTLIGSGSVSSSTFGTAGTGFAQWNDTGTNSSGSATLGVTVNLTPGETIWVWAWLDSWAPNGSTVDASHTFVTQWSSPADLTPGPSAVPVPAAGWLLLSALAGLGLLAGRRSGPIRTLASAA